MDDLDFSQLDLALGDDLLSPGRGGRKARRAQTRAKAARQAAKDLAHDPALRKLADLLDDLDEEDGEGD